MKDKNQNKLTPYVSKSVLQRLQYIEHRSPTLFKIIEGFIVAIAIPIMALRALFFKLTGGVFADLQVPWTRVLILAIAAYVLTQKNLGFTFNLNSPTVATTAPAPNVMVSHENSSWAMLPTAPSEAEVKRYIGRFSKTAVSEMLKFKIPASIKLAQGIVESHAGKSQIAIKGNNHFNIRCAENSRNPCIQTPHGDFRRYTSAWEGWRAHSTILTQTKFGVLTQGGRDYKKWARGLQDLGYSVDKYYAQRLIQIIEQHELVVFDQ